MDIISHGLYGGIAWGRANRKEYWLAFLFGMFPDLVAFSAFFIKMLVTGQIGPTNLQVEPPHTLIAPEYVYRLYDFSHSLVVFAVVFGLVWLIRKRPWWVMLAWPFHIMLDIPTHSAGFFPTPFLWPISRAHIDGIPWSHEAIFIPNLVLLAVLYSWWWFHKKQ